MSRSNRMKADALAKAALQATARALHTAQLAADAYKRALDQGAGGETLRDRAVMLRLRDQLLDAYGDIEAQAKARMLASPATITSDELIDLLALCVRGE